VEEGSVHGRELGEPMAEIAFYFDIDGPNSFHLLKSSILWVDNVTIS
jgi:hypothetical protein